MVALDAEVDTIRAAWQRQAWAPRDVIVQAEEIDEYTIKCTLLPLRAIFRRSVRRGEVMVDPCAGLELAAVRGGRDRIASADEAARLLSVLTDTDRAIWATAMYAGLRLGALRALRVESIDLAAGVIHVERGWDDKEGEISVKSAAARRRVPIAGVLRDLLAEHRMSTDRTGRELAFGRTPFDAFNPKTLQQRADEAWGGAGLKRLTLHECRHSYASLMIAAGGGACAGCRCVMPASHGKRPRGELVSLRLDPAASPSRARTPRLRARSAHVARRVA